MGVFQLFCVLNMPVLSLIIFTFLHTPKFGHTRKMGFRNIEKVSNMKIHVQVSHVKTGSYRITRNRFFSASSSKYMLQKHIIFISTLYTTRIKVPSRLTTHAYDL